MMPATHHILSEQEYLAIENASDSKHELINGVAYAMAGASPAHNVITSNLAYELRAALQTAGRRCLVLGSDQRLLVEATGMYTYPDISVVCAKPQFHGDSPQSLVNPSLLVEVLSPSTASDDRGNKFAHYRRLPSLQELLFVYQDEPRVEHYKRLESGQWLMTEITEGAVELPGLGCALPMDGIYAQLEMLA